MATPTLVLSFNNCTLRLLIITIFLSCSFRNSISCSLNISDNDWVGPSTTLIPDYVPKGAAIGYSSANNEVLLLGGGLPQRLLSFNPATHTFTTVGSTWLSQSIGTDTFSPGEFYTQHNQYLYIINDVSKTSFIRFNVDTKAIEYNYNTEPLRYEAGVAACLAAMTATDNHEYLFILGTGYCTGCTPVISDIIQIFDITDHVWLSNVPSMRVKRSEFACIVMSDTLYMIGGRLESGYSETVEILDVTDMNAISGETWNVLTDRLSKYMYDHRALAFHTDIVCVGGYSNGYVTDINVIDTVTNTIKVRGNTPEFGYGPPAVIADNALYVFAQFGLEWFYLSLPDITCSPTSHPTSTPTSDPAPYPTTDPTEEPTVDPTAQPTEEPTMDPTRDPTIEPTINPTLKPTTQPTLGPTVDPTSHPTKSPSTPSPILIVGAPPTPSPTQIILPYYYTTVSRATAADSGETDNQSLNKSDVFWQNKQTRVNIIWILSILLVLSFILIIIFLCKRTSEKPLPVIIKHHTVPLTEMTDTIKLQTNTKRNVDPNEDKLTEANPMLTAATRSENEELYVVHVPKKTAGGDMTTMGKAKETEKQHIVIGNDETDSDSDSDTTSLFEQHTIMNANKSEEIPDLPHEDIQ